MSNADDDILNTVIYYYYYLDMLHLFDSQRYRHIDVKYRNYFDSYINTIDPLKQYSVLSMICSNLLYQIYQYSYIAMPKKLIKDIGKEWHELATKINDVQGVIGRDGDGVYIMGVVVDKLNTWFEFQNFVDKQLPVLRCIFVNHLFLGTSTFCISLDGDILRLYDAIFYNYIQVSFYISHIKQTGEVIDIYLDSCQKAVFTFIESLLDSIGLEVLDLEGHDEPYLNVSDERIKVLLSSKRKDNKIIPCFMPFNGRLRDFVIKARNDGQDCFTVELTNAIDGFLNFMDVRSAIIHPGFNKWTKTERTLERKYLQTKQLILAALSLAKNIWQSTLNASLPTYLCNFSFEQSIQYIRDKQNVFTYYKDTQLEYKEPELYM